ncbi:NRDE family protein [Prolixibacter sp. NT017]|uniref:NRDE family protein n=1 Tax=Prolixibacter sp. NT017 TaxID=2652390 RepID=UPI001285A3BF|nr:NRDE family protein [Prolixibacter sp. NT017]GET24402.1 hypothetical protein NT017_07310 [Prolixibacter sp. NT017]
MCTVSYIPNANGSSFVLTSNRDEKAFRPTIAPQIYELGETKTGFPKDEKAGGSWIAANNNGRLCCLLNGAFVAHEKKPHYTQSRGNILVELASSSLSPVDFYENKNLMNVEPFTIVTVETSNNKITHFSEFIWDGNKKHFKELNPGEPQIWSSVTLYSEEHRNLRKQWFGRFLKNVNGNISPESILGFHSGKHTSDNSINTVMEREGGLKTVSITQVIPENGKFRMSYFDLHNHVNTAISI